MKQIRNFCIIAHIDHGKSTLADRLLQTTNTVSERQMMDQVLDDMDLEREKGITIKSHAIQLDYKYSGTQADFAANNKYTLNLIDTPGHVDFSYEVSRALAACEGALLLVDAAQGIQAQTISNLYLAIENDLEIIPVINKIDMDGAKIEETEDQIIELIGCKRESILRASGRTGLGVDAILENIVERIPAPKGDPDAPLQALIFDSVFNSFRGIIVYYRIINGTLRKADMVKFAAVGTTYGADEVGILKMGLAPREVVHCGDVGYIITGIKVAKEVKVGDTITLALDPAEEPLPGYVEATPMVFCGMFPTDADQFEDLREALEKLKLSDAALHYEPETSSAMGFGFRCGFLGLLHMEIVQERLEREYNLDLITTAPSVVYRVTTLKDGVILIDNPSKLPDPQHREKIEEPYVQVDMITPEEYVGALMELSQTRRGVFKDMKYLTPGRTTLIYDLPLAEVATDFFDQMKSRSRGYASMEYKLIGYRENPLVKLDVMINGDPVDPLATIVHRDKAYGVGRA
ncbi:MAG: elongation factor 4, partial [Bacteroidetes bacterium]